MEAGICLITENEARLQEMRRCIRSGVPGKFDVDPTGADACIHKKGREMRKNYIALDLETTGLSPRKDHILEIGAVRVEDNEPVEKFACFVDPGILVPAHITQLTGIDTAMARSGEQLRPAMEKFLEFCGDSVILGHNISFDFGFLQQNAANLGKTFPCLGIDTLQLARKFLPQLPSRRLGDLCTYYGIRQTRQHRAFEDASAASLLYQRLAEEFGEGQEKSFEPVRLSYAVKKESPITNSQKVYLNDLAKYHKIELNVVLDTLTKSQASRMIDGILLQYGRIIKR